MKIYEIPQIRLVNIDTEDLMDPAISTIGDEGEGDQLSNDFDDHLDNNVSKGSVWDTEE